MFPPVLQGQRMHFRNAIPYEEVQQHSPCMPPACLHPMVEMHMLICSHPLVCLVTLLVKVQNI